MLNWESTQSVLQGCLDRRWYTNHGPMARRLEAAVAERLGAPHAIAVTNPTIGLIMLAEAQSLRGEVLLSALAPPRCAQSLAWAGLCPVFCDVEPEGLGLNVSSAAGAAGSGTAAILATPGADLARLAGLATEQNLPCYGDTIALSAGPGLIALPMTGDDAGIACLLTDDNDLAARLRNIRSSYGAGRPVPGNRTANGRVSEIQAALALHVVEHAAKQYERNSTVNRSDEFKILAYGNETMLVAGTLQQRGELLACCERANWPARPLRLNDRAQHCAVAASIAERTLLLPAELLHGPGLRRNLLRAAA